jgi:hypothetical protein
MEKGNDMNPKRQFQAMTALVFLAMTIGLYFVFAVPLLQFASAGAVGHLPTQIFVLLIRILAYGTVSVILCLGIYFSYRFKLTEIFSTLLLGLYFVILGVGMKMGTAIYIVTVTAFSPLLFILRRSKSAILTLQNKYLANTDAHKNQP